MSQSSAHLWNCVCHAPTVRKLHKLHISMVGPAHIVLGALLLSFFPAQAKHVATQAKAGGMSIETGEACAGLSAAECCGQMLELAGFRAQGDHLPRLIKTTVHLACMNEQKTVTPQVCRSIS